MLINSKGRRQNRDRETAVTRVETSTQLVGPRELLSLF